MLVNQTTTLIQTMDERITSGNADILLQMRNAQNRVEDRFSALEANLTIDNKGRSLLVVLLRLQRRYRPWLPGQP